MLTEVDRIQMAAEDADAVAEMWQRLLDASRVREDQVPVLGARRVVLSVGASEVEILSPVGPGPVAAHVAAGNGGPFAAGLATNDLAAVRRHLDRMNVAYVDNGDQLFAGPEDLAIDGLRVVITESRERTRVGLLNNLYEVTHLTRDAHATAASIARTFALNQSHFVPIHSDPYGYDGYLTLFRPEALHRIEAIYPFDTSKTMGRFHRRAGDCLYMCYAETDDVGAVRARLISEAPHGWTGDAAPVPDGLFIHPKALGGVMMGVSRTTHAWSWSGHPDWVKPAE
ncbi:MAG: hypothetical protein P8Y95_05845 [Gammaproteobacteria bacterium]